MLLSSATLCTTPIIMSFSYDILFCILTRLSVKSLLRFQSVSKLWDTIISDDKFKKAHCDQSKTLGRLKFLLHNDVDEIESVELQNPQLVIEKQRLPLTDSHVICSHDGLVLLHTHKADDTFVLWNPSIRQHKIFVCPYLNNSFATANACGLSYDSTTEYYKVILIYKSFYVICYANHENYWTMQQTLPVIEQSLEDAKINYDGHCNGITEGINPSGGWVYWSLDSTMSGRKLLFQYVLKTSTIIRFNAQSDELEELPPPDFICERESYVMSTLKGRLSLYGEKTESDVWIMEQDEWKLFLKIRQLIPYVRFNKILCCTKDGEIIFHGLVQHIISTFNPTKQTFVMRSYRRRSRISRYVYQDQTCLDSFSFPRLNTHQQDEGFLIGFT